MLHEITFLSTEEPKAIPYTVSFKSTPFFHNFKWQDFNQLIKNTGQGKHSFAVVSTQIFHKNNSKPTFAPPGKA